MDGLINIITFSSGVQPFVVRCEPETRVRDIVSTIAEIWGFREAAGLFTLCRPSADCQDSSDVLQLLRGSSLLAWNDKPCKTILPDAKPTSAPLLLVRCVFGSGAGAAAGVEQNPVVLSLTAAQVAADVAIGRYPHAFQADGVLLQHLVKQGQHSMVLHMASCWQSGTCLVVGPAQVLAKAPQLQLPNVVNLGFNYQGIHVMDDQLYRLRLDIDAVDTIAAAGDVLNISFVSEVPDLLLQLLGAEAVAEVFRALKEASKKPSASASVASGAPATAAADDRDALEDPLAVEIQVVDPNQQQRPCLRVALEVVEELAAPGVALPASAATAPPAAAAAEGTAEAVVAALSADLDERQHQQPQLLQQEEEQQKLVDVQLEVLEAAADAADEEQHLIKLHLRPVVQSEALPATDVAAAAAGAAASEQRAPGVWVRLHIIPEQPEEPQAPPENSSNEQQLVRLVLKLKGSSSSAAGANQHDALGHDTLMQLLQKSSGTAAAAADTGSGAALASSAGLASAAGVLGASPVGLVPGQQSAPVAASMTPTSAGLHPSMQFQQQQQAGMASPSQASRLQQQHHEMRQGLSGPGELHLLQPGPGGIRVQGSPRALAGPGRVMFPAAAGPVGSGLRPAAPAVRPRPQFQQGFYDPPSFAGQPRPAGGYSVPGGVQQAPHMRPAAGLQQQQPAYQVLAGQQGQLPGPGQMQRAGVPGIAYQGVATSTAFVGGPRPQLRQQQAQQQVVAAPGGYMLVPQQQQQQQSGSVGLQSGGGQQMLLMPVQMQQGGVAQATGQATSGMMLVTTSDGRQVLVHENQLMQQPQQQQQQLQQVQLQIQPPQQQQPQMMQLQQQFHLQQQPQQLQAQQPQQQQFQQQFQQSQQQSAHVNPGVFVMGPNGELVPAGGQGVVQQQPATGVHQVMLQPQMSQFQQQQQQQQFLVQQQQQQALQQQQQQQALQQQQQQQQRQKQLQQQQQQQLLLQQQQQQQQQLLLQQQQKQQQQQQQQLQQAQQTAVPAAFDQSQLNQFSQLGLAQGQQGLMQQPQQQQQQFLAVSQGLGGMQQLQLQQPGGFQQQPQQQLQLQGLPNLATGGPVMSAAMVGPGHQLLPPQQQQQQPQSLFLQQQPQQPQLQSMQLLGGTSMAQNPNTALLGQQRRSSGSNLAVGGPASGQMNQQLFAGPPSTGSSGLTGLQSAIGAPQNQGGISGGGLGSGLQGLRGFSFAQDGVGTGGGMGAVGVIGDAALRGGAPGGGFLGGAAAGGFGGFGTAVSSGLDSSSLGGAAAAVDPPGLTFGGSNPGGGGVFGAGNTPKAAALDQGGLGLVMAGGLGGFPDGMQAAAGGAAGGFVFQNGVGTGFDAAGMGAFSSGLQNSTNGPFF